MFFVYRALKHYHSPVVFWPVLADCDSDVSLSLLFCAGCLLLLLRDCAVFSDDDEAHVSRSSELWPITCGLTSDDMSSWKMVSHENITIVVQKKYEPADKCVFVSSVFQNFRQKWWWRSKRCSKVRPDLDSPGSKVDYPLYMLSVSVNLETLYFLVVPLKFSGWWVVTYEPAD